MKMKKRLQGFCAGFMAAIAVAGVAVAAKSLYEKIDVYYNNIKIVIDGSEYTPTDANGNTVEPFIYNGTTFLPVRAIANAFDKDVRWDDKTYTVYIDTKKDGGTTVSGKYTAISPEEYLKALGENGFLVQDSAYNENEDYSYTRILAQKNSVKIKYYNISDRSLILDDYNECYRITDDMTIPEGVEVITNVYNDEYLCSEITKRWESNHVYQSAVVVGDTYIEVLCNIGDMDIAVAFLKSIGYK